MNSYMLERTNKLVLCWHPCQGALFSYSFIILFHTQYKGFYNSFLNKPSSPPFLIPSLKSTQDAWSPTPSFGVVEKPTIWLDMVIVDVYEWYQFLVHNDSTQYWLFPHVFCRRRRYFNFASWFAILFAKLNVPSGFRTVDLPIA